MCIHMWIVWLWIPLVAFSAWAVNLVLLRRQVQRYPSVWREMERETRARHSSDTPLLVALGNSAGVGIGASEPLQGYVGQFARRLGICDVINVCVSGSTLCVNPHQHVHKKTKHAFSQTIFSQLQAISTLPKCVSRPTIVTVDIGSNDLGTFRPELFERELERLCEEILERTKTLAHVRIVVGELPCFNGRAKFECPNPDARVRAANAIIRRVVWRYDFCVTTRAARAIMVAPLYEQTRAHNGSPLCFAADWFHPNDRGYATWTDAYVRACSTSRRVVR